MSEGKLYGLYRGTVENHMDPERKSRMLVRVPSLNGTGAIGWALPCFPYLTQQPKLEGSAGPYGVSGKTAKITLRLPRPGDAVWVMFENGDPGSPVWLGTWRGV
jgi:hypothetical protein